MCAPILKTHNVTGYETVSGVAAPFVRFACTVPQSWQRLIDMPHVTHFASLFCDIRSESNSSRLASSKIRGTALEQHSELIVAVRCAEVVRRSKSDFGFVHF